MSTAKPKLRFAALIRVSTEKQAAVGESLRTQRADAERSVEIMNGLIVEWYGGQEHATPGFEKKEVEKLLRDASRPECPFDAVVVAHADRWSRDNSESKRGLEVFRSNNIRFFVGSFEYNLFNPQHRFYLGMSAEIGEFQASTQKEKSILNRISRAERGLPACGKLPFGRTYNKRTEKWGVDPVKVAMMEDIAKRYLAGERLADLAKEYRVNHANMHKVLTKRCGEVWTQDFCDKSLNIEKSVTTTIPRLLPEATIKAVHRQIQKNRTYEHGHAKNNYLLRGFLYCDECGYAMTGLPGNKGRIYYRHANPSTRVRVCPGPIPNVHIRASEIEEVVIRELFTCFGNPAAVEKAIKAATPNKVAVEELFQKQTKLLASLDELEASKQRVISLIARGVISEVDAEKQIHELNASTTRTQQLLQTISKGLENVPNPKQIKAIASRMSGVFKGRAVRYGNARLVATTRLANSDIELMTPEEMRALIVNAFEDGATLDGKPMGVYVKLVPGSEHNHTKRFRFTIHGRIHQCGYLDKVLNKYDDENQNSHSPSRCKAPTPPAPHSSAQSPPPSA